MGNRILRACETLCETIEDKKVLQVVDLQGKSGTPRDRLGWPETSFFLDGVQGVASSNPAVPTNDNNGLRQ
jgi:hypothetical protein